MVKTVGDVGYLLSRVVNMERNYSHSRSIVLQVISNRSIIHCFASFENVVLLNSFLTYPGHIAFKSPVPLAIKSPPKHQTVKLFEISHTQIVVVVVVVVVLVFCFFFSLFLFYLTVPPMPLC